MQTKTTCYVHPDRETILRCNRCERPICNECAVLTPVGYRCKNCVKSQQKVFDITFNTATSTDLVIGPVIAFVLSAAGSLLSLLPCTFVIIFIAIAWGWGISELVRRAVRRRRSKLLFRLVGAALLAGSLLLPLGILVLTGLHGWTGLLWPMAYAVLVTVSGYSNMNGNSIKV